MRVDEYIAAWNLDTNEGRIKILFEGQSKFIKIPSESAAEFIAMLTILQGDGTAYYNKKGWLGTQEIEDWDVQ